MLSKVRSQCLVRGHADSDLVHLVVKQRQVGLGTALISAPLYSQAQSR